MIQPIYVRLQALQSGSVVLWEAVPQSFSDHVGTIDLSDLAVLVSSNAQTVNLSRDDVGNLWVAINYTFAKGDYIGTLTWVSSDTVSENLTIPTVVSFPQSYPSDVAPFLNSGRKMPVENEEIEKIANNIKTENMIETVKNVLSYATETQEYARETARLLVSGNLTTTSMLDYFKGPLEVLESNSSMCFERALFEEAILRAAGVPTRTFTDAGLKTWIQVWLPDQGWVDAESLCIAPAPHPPPIFPRSLSSSIPWMAQNSSDAIFPFQWFPEVPMRVSNLTFSNVEAFNIGEYRTLLVQPIDEEVFNSNPERFRFPIIYKPKIIEVAVTQKGSTLTISLIKDEEKVSKILTLNETNSVSLGDTTLSFEPIRRDYFVVLQNFLVQEPWGLDFRLFIIPIVGVPVVVVFWLYWRRKRIKRPRNVTRQAYKILSQLVTLNVNAENQRMEDSSKTVSSR